MEEITVSINKDDVALPMCSELRSTAHPFCEVTILSFTINLKSISGIGGEEASALALVVQTLFPNLFGAWVVALVRTLDCFGISGIGGVEALALALVVHTILLYTPFIVSGRLVKRAKI